MGFIFSLILFIVVFCSCQHAPQVVREPQSLSVPPPPKIRVPAPFSLAPLGQGLGVVREDMRIYAGVNDVVEEVLGSGQKIYVAVKNGSVALTGEIENFRQKELLQNSLEQISGIKSLNIDLITEGSRRLEAGFAWGTWLSLGLLATLLGLGMIWRSHC